jgi:hypothetical protein
MDNKIYGFDSFKGLPFSEGKWKKGEYTSSLKDTKKNIEKATGKNKDIVLIKGIYEDLFKNKKIEEAIGISECSILHIDCDLPSSCEVVLNACSNLINPSMYIVLHDWTDGVREAWEKFSQEQNIEFEFISQTALQRGIRILKNG